MSYFQYDHYATFFKDMVSGMSHCFDYLLKCPQVGLQSDFENFAMHRSNANCGPAQERVTT